MNTHMYRDIHEFHDPCYYCAYNGTKGPSSTRPPLVCEQCPGGQEGYHAEKDRGEDGNSLRRTRPKKEEQV